LGCRAAPAPARAEQVRRNRLPVRGAHSSASGRRWLAVLEAEGPKAWPWRCELAERATLRLGTPMRPLSLGADFPPGHQLAAPHTGQLGSHQKPPANCS